MNWPNHPDSASGTNTKGLYLTIAAVAILIALSLTAWYRLWPVTLAASLGALGGLAHELAQSRGWFFFPQTTEDHTHYLGAFTGMALGALAGALAVQSLVTLKVPDTVDVSVGSVWWYQFAYTSFLAGLSLKGISEAATTNISRR